MRASFARRGVPAAWGPKRVEVAPGCDGLIATRQLIRAGKRRLVSIAQGDVGRDGDTQPCALLEPALAPLSPTTVSA